MNKNESAECLAKYFNMGERQEEEFTEQQKLDEESINQSNQWNRSLIRAEFLKIYLESMGLKDSFEIVNLNDLFAITRGAHSQNCLFAIVEVNKDSENFKYEVKSDAKMAKNHEKAKKSQIEMSDAKEEENAIRSKCQFFFNENLCERYDNSLNFLELLYTGLFNQSREIFKEDSELKAFFERADEHISKWDYSKLEEERIIPKREDNLNVHQNYERVIEEIELTPSLLDYFLKRDQQLLNKHNEITKEVFKGRIDKLKQEERKYYSLFFLYEGNLVEYVPHENMLKIRDRGGITNTNFAKALSNYISAKNLESQEGKADKVSNQYYRNDVFIFNEQLFEEKVEPITTNVGEFLLTCVYTILFLVTFMEVVPHSKFFFHREDINSKVPLNYHPLNYDDVYKNILQNVRYFYNEEDFEYLDYPPYHSIPYDEYDTWSPYYFKGETLVTSGGAINFKLRKIDSEKRPDHFKMNFDRLEDEDFPSYTKDPIYKGTYQLFIKAEEEYPSDEVNSLLDFIKYQDPKELSFTLMLYDAETDVTIINSVKYIFDALGYIEVKEKINGFRAFLNTKAIFLKLLIINIFWILLAIYDLVRLMSKIINKIIDYCKQKINSFNLGDLLDFVSSFVILACQIWFYASILWAKKSFPIVINDESDFKYWIDYATEMNAYRKFAAFALFFVILKFILIFYNSFPALGIVIDTFNSAIKEFLIIFFLFFTMLLVFFFGLETALGGFSFSYLSWGNSYLRTFLLFFGIFDYEGDYEPYNEKFQMIPYIWIAAYVLFHMIFFHLFFCIIKAYYYQVKTAKQMVHDAMLQMMVDSVIGFYNKFMNLILFIDTEKPEGEKSNKSIYQIFIYNLKSLDLLSLFRKSMLNAEEFEKETKSKCREVRQQKIDSYIDELEIEEGSAHFDMLAYAVVFILHIVIYILMLFYQMKISLRRSIGVYEENYIKEKFFSFVNDTELYKDSPENIKFPYLFFNQLTKVEGIDDIRTYWETFNDFVVDPLYEDLEKFESGTSDIKLPENYITIDKNAFKDFKMVGEPYFRVTFRLYDVKDMDSTSEAKEKKQIFNHYVSAHDDFLIFDSNKKYERSYVLKDCYKKTNCVITKRGDEYHSFDNMGGIVYSFTNNTLSPTFYNHLISEINNIGSINLDFALFSLDYSIALYVQASYLRNMNYIDKYKIKFHTIPINLYKTDENFARIVLEIIHYVLVLYYFFWILGEVFKLLKEKMLYNWETSGQKEEYEDSNIFQKYYRFSNKSFKKDTGALLCLKMVFIPIFKFIYKTILLVYLFVLSILNYIFSNIFNMLNLFSVILTVAMFGLWFRIIHVTHRLDLTDYKSSAVKMHNNIETMNNLQVLYQRYLYWQAVSIFIIFFRLFPFLRFSHSVNLIFNIIYNSKLLVAVYILFLLLINLGFVLFGYACFSLEFFNFKNLGIAFLNVFVILSGAMKPKDVLDVNDDTWTPIFVTIFIFTNALLLLNFFYSVLSEEYNDMKARQRKNLGVAHFSALRDFGSNFVKKENEFLEICAKYGTELFKAYQFYLQKYSQYYTSIESAQREKEGNKEVGFCKKLSSKKKITLSFLNIVMKLINDVKILNPFLKKTYSMEEKEENIKKESEENKPLKKKKSKKQELEEILNEQQKRLKGKTVIGSIVLEDYHGIYAIDLDVNLYASKYLSQNLSIFHRLFLYVTFMFGYKSVTFEEKEIPPEKKKESHEKYLGLFKYRNKALIDVSDWQKTFYFKYRELIGKDPDSYLKLSTFDKDNLFTHPNIHSLKPFYNLRPPSLQTYMDVEVKTPTRYSKETILESHDELHKNDFFYIPSLLSTPKKEFYKIVGCENKCYKSEEGKPCEKCKEIQKFFDTLKVNLFDEFVKYFYMPPLDVPDDKDLYIGYYVFKALIKSQPDLSKFRTGPMDLSKIIKSLNKSLPNFFINEFTENVFKRMEEDKKTYPWLNPSLKEKETYVEYLGKKMYYLYTIWDTLHTFIFNTDSYKIKDIREKSISYAAAKKYIADKRQNEIDLEEGRGTARDLRRTGLKLEEGTLFYFLIKKHTLKHITLPEMINEPLTKEQELYKVLQERYDRKNKISEVLRNLLRNENSSTEQNNFSFNEFVKSDAIYFNNERFYFMDDEEMKKDDACVPGKINKVDPEIILDSYPKIFREIWEKEDEDVLCALFFGFNKHISFVDTDFDSKDMLGLYAAMDVVRNQPQLTFNITRCFQDIHKADVISMLNPFEIIPLISRNIIKNKISLAGDAAKNYSNISTLGDLINFFTSYQINLVDRHIVYFEIFNELFSEAKAQITQMNNDSYLVFKKLFKAKAEMLSPTSRIILADLFTLVQERDRYRYLKGFFKTNYVKYEEKMKSKDGREIDWIVSLIPIFCILSLFIFVLTNPASFNII
ncbi:MAG: ion transporter, partial [archaeon]|nr:ion transporter [archaeon]